MEQCSVKTYVPVLVRYEADGRMTPMEIEWENGDHFPIDRVTDVRRAASLKAGGAGIRYTVRISGKETYLFLEDNRWFVERRRQTQGGI